MLIKAFITFGKVHASWVFFFFHVLGYASYLLALASELATFFPLTTKNLKTNSQNYVLRLK